MQLTIVTPESPKLAQDVAEVTLPGKLGEMQILPGPTPVVSALEVGILTWQGAEGNGMLAVNRGFVEVLDDQVSVLTETCEASDEVDVDRAKDALQRAREHIERSQTDESIDAIRAEYALKRALMRLKASGID